MSDRDRHPGGFIVKLQRAIKPGLRNPPSPTPSHRSPKIFGFFFRRETTIFGDW